MKLELTMGEAINLNSAIVAAQMRLKGAKFALGLRLAYNAKQLVPVVTSFEETRSELLDKYAEKAEDGSLVDLGEGRVKLADAKGFNKDVADLLAERFDVDLKQIDEKLFPAAVDADIIGGLYPILAGGE
jgi:hypothetical protein